MKSKTTSRFEKFNQRFGIEKLAYSYNQIRAGHFALQGALLPLIARLTDSAQDRPDISVKDYFRLILPKVEKLFAQDAKNIADGIYPMSVLIPENPVKHFTRIPFLLVDAVRANLQKQKKQTKKFAIEVDPILGKLPDYYKRNFHFQDSGYLGKNSANLYDHQVEVLFSGTADAMRRLIIPVLKKRFTSIDGQGLHFLELGCGTGRITRFIALAFPAAKITVVDLSPYYLELAKWNLKDFKNISYVRGNAEHLKFKGKTFDAIYSGFLFHELPNPIRARVHKESFRLLKSKGLYAILDSLQKNDDKEMNWALEQFPKDFHEPFYKDYTLRSISQQMIETGFKNPSVQIGFLSKVSSSAKP